MLNSKIGKQVEFEDEVVLDQNGNRRARDSEGMSLLFCVYFLLIVSSGLYQDF